MALTMGLHFVRHGQSEWNALGRVQGQASAPGLTSLGVAQAQRAAAVLAEVGGIDRVLTSDLVRAEQTAAAIGAVLGQPVWVEPRLREQSMGRLEGLTSATAFAATADVAWSESTRLGGAASESVRDVAARVGSLLAELMSAPAASGVVLVSHGDTIRIALGWLAETAPDREFDVDALRLTNGSVTTVALLDGVAVSLDQR